MAQSSELGGFFLFMIHFFNVVRSKLCLVVAHNAVQSNSFIDDIIGDQKMFFAFGSFSLGMRIMSFYTEGRLMHKPPHL